MTRQPTWPHQPEEHGTIRLLALWLLLEGSEQAASKGSRIGEDSFKAEGGQPTGWPPAPAASPASVADRNHRAGVVKELRILLTQEIEGFATPQETRRVAEILEVLDRDAEARTWWERAAVKGDEDARDYLQILDAERDEELSACREKPGKSLHEGEEFESFVTRFACRSADTGVTAGRIDSVLGEAGVQLSEGTEVLVREIEDFLKHLDHTTGGPRC